MFQYKQLHVVIKKILCIRFLADNLIFSEMVLYNAFMFKQYVIGT